MFQSEIEWHTILIDGISEGKK